MISVVIPVYNAADVIGRCLDSILGNQTDLEVVAVNDGSTDGSGEVLDSYAAKDARVKVFHQENRGNSLSRDAGIEKSSGDYIMFADADDRLEKGALDLLAVYLARKPDLLAFGYWIDFVEENYSVDRILQDKTYRDSFAAAVDFIRDTGSFNLLWNKVYRADLLRGHHDFPFMKTTGQDFIFNCHVFPRINSVISISTQLYHYEKRARETMVTRYLSDGYGNLQRKEQALGEMLEAYGRSNDPVYADYMLSEYEVYVLNLFSPQCPLSLQEKIEEVQKNIYTGDTAEMLKKGHAAGTYTKLFQKLLKLGPVGLVRVYTVLSSVKNNAGGLYKGIRRVVNRH